MTVSAGEPRGAVDGTIKVLIIDDNPIDAELARMALRRGGVVGEYVTAVDERELRDALATFRPDVVLCDFSFPNLDGFAAQRIVRENCPEAPLIFVSGSISEDRAVTALQSGAVDFVLKSSLARLPNAVQRAVGHARDKQSLERSLRDSEARARQHAERLEALWRIVNDPTLRDADLWPAMLGQASVSIWPGDASRGTLWRLRDADLVLEAFVDGPGLLLERADLVVGAAIPLAGSAIALVLDAGGGTRSWDDVRHNPEIHERVQSQGTRSLVITTFSAGGTTWALAFASGRPASQLLGPQEHAYVDVLASFFSNRVQQRWQFDRIQYQQSHDVLTGLLNRSQFRSQAGTASRVNSRYAVILVDIDAFHEVNESYGHMIADALLVEVANALRGRAYDDEIVARVGGDLFAIYIANPSSKAAIRERLVAIDSVFASAFSTGDREGVAFVALTATIGAAAGPDDGDTLDSVSAHADTALAAAKARGRGSQVLYEAGMEGDAQRRATLRNELFEAIATDQFELYYQPHVELRTGNIAGCEALIRWNHPVSGLISPGQFIPFAEQNGIITSIDAWVMRNAFAAANELSVLGPNFRLYFNLSGRQVSDPKLIRAFTTAARDGVALHHLGVEITESDSMRNVEATRHVCRALRRLDVKVAIDDFGTGYSSLASLARFPVDIVKVDRSFVSGVTNDAHDGTIAETIIAIADRFGFESLGEGAEQPEEVEWLRRHGCHYVQGFAICKPMPVDEFKAWIASYDGGIVRVS